MSSFEAIILGILQGVTEFAPISSSAHLVIVPHFFGWGSPPILFMVTLHLGTLFAVFWYFKTEMIRMFWSLLRSLGGLSARDDPSARLAWLIILGTVPAGLMGFFLNDFFSGLFENPFAAAIFLLVTGFILLLGERLGKQVRDLDEIKVSDGLLVGLAQGLAITPGISRSGITIATGLASGLKRESAAHFSFLLSFPIILGAFAETIAGSNISLHSAILPALGFGFAGSLLSGYFCIKYLMGYLKKGSLAVFAYYCFAMGVFTIIFRWLAA
jgi:undecaprenyl-diphosphatase